MPLAGDLGSTSAGAGALITSVLRSRDEIDPASTELPLIVDADTLRLSASESGRLPKDLCLVPAWFVGTCKPLGCVCGCSCSCRKCLFCGPSASGSSSPSAVFGREDAVTKDLVLERRGVWILLGSNAAPPSSSGSDGASTKASLSSSTSISAFCSKARGICRAGGDAVVAAAARLGSVGLAPSSSSSVSSISGCGKLCWKRAEELGPSRPLSRRWRASRGSEENVAARDE